MKIRFSKFRKFSSLLGQVIILTVLVSQQAEAALPCQITTRSFSFLVDLEKNTVFQKNSSNIIIARVQSIDWTFLEIVRDLPQIILKNSLTVWINDYARGPFYISPNIHFP